MLGRKPKQLSGGQRQRVAMGRAIVRSPGVFLMDEPLSNLDAKLRVQMRSEVVRVHRSIGAATLYVTHDQTEAMTMGDRVAVLRPRHASAVDPARPLFFDAGPLVAARLSATPPLTCRGPGSIWGAGAADDVSASQRLALPASDGSCTISEGWNRIATQWP